MNKQNATFYYNSICHKLFDEEQEISPATLQSDNFKALVIPDVFNPLEAEWAADSFGIGNEVEMVVLDPAMVLIELKKVRSGRDLFLRIIAENSVNNLIVGDKSNGFFFTSYTNRFTLLFGTETFVQNAWRGSVDTARMMYFDYWADDYGKDSAEYKDLLRVWNKYEPFFPQKGTGP